MPAPDLPLARTKSHGRGTPTAVVYVDRVDFEVTLLPLVRKARSQVPFAHVSKIWMRTVVLPEIVIESTNGHHLVTGLSQEKTVAFFQVLSGAFDDFRHRPPST